MIRILCAALSLVVAVSPLRADIVSGKAEKRAASEAGVDRTVEAQLAAAGASAGTAAVVVQGMTPADLAYYGANPESVQAAGHHGAIIWILVVAAIVILILYLTDNLR
jgi:hypothetical protein